MRLIDADELLKQIKYKPIPNIICETWNDLYERVIEEIDNAPTVEPKQGKWDEICEPFGWDDILSARCSVCGESYPYPEDTGFNDIVEMFKYCPNCGAKMEAGNRWKEEDE